MARVFLVLLMSFPFRGWLLSRLHRRVFIVIAVLSRVTTGQLSNACPTTVLQVAPGRMQRWIKWREFFAVPPIYPLLSGASVFVFNTFICIFSFVASQRACLGYMSTTRPLFQRVPCLRAGRYNWTWMSIVFPFRNGLSGPIRQAHCFGSNFIKYVINIYVF
jgi:hypothetical protein